MLDFFDLDNAVPIVLLILLLRFVGGQMNEDIRVRGWCKGAGVLCFLFLGIVGLTEGADGAWDLLTLAFRAVLALGLGYALMSILAPIGLFLHHHIKRKEAVVTVYHGEALPDPPKQAESPKKSLPPPTPPPTREELMADAKARYESTVRMLESAGLNEMELEAAKEKAKQQMLREIDWAIQ